ncbi:MAG: oxidoreductase [Acidimicrobiales bacterium]
MGWTQDDIPDQTGRVAVVTGANGGLGLETAKALAGKGAQVVMAARNQDKAKSARDQILAAHPEASLEIVELDLGNQQSVTTAATRIAADHQQVDILVNNAGLMAMPEATTDEGYEMQFGVHHLGHWTFTAGLLTPLLNAPAGRVVTVTSIARLQGRPVDPDNPHLRGRYAPWRAYGQAKLANYHFGIGLQQRFERAGVAAISLVAHPGLSNTDLQSTTVEAGGGGFLARASHAMAERTGMEPSEGVRPQLRAAVDPEAEGGWFYGPRFGTNGPAVRLWTIPKPWEQRAIDTLWRVSEAETGVAMDVPTAAG